MDNVTSCNGSSGLSSGCAFASRWQGVDCRKHTFRGDAELRTELFRPGYYSATRSSISGSPTVGAYGGSITIPTSSASTVSKATLVKCPDTTHHYDSNMRCLTFSVKSRTSSSVTVQAPLNANLAPPGYYYIHIVNISGIPSLRK